MMQYRTSIEATHKVFQTNGSQPVLVTRDDLEYWVCKYDSSVYSLFNEFIASRFLNIWNIPTPPIGFITVLPEHITDSIIGGRIQPRFFQKHCFGSKYLSYAKEVDAFFESFKNNTYELNKINSREDFLKIGLFDLWLSNEDRNHNNYNLLLKPEDDGTYVFNAIDHVNCFNTGNLGRPLYHLSENESILKSEIVDVLFSKGAKLRGIVDELSQELYICSTRCRESLDDILSDLPATWDLNVDQIRRDIEQIFEIAWLQDTEEIFKRYVQLGIH